MNGTAVGNNLLKVSYGKALLLTEVGGVTGRWVGRARDEADVRGDPKINDFSFYQAKEPHARPLLLW